MKKEVVPSDVKARRVASGEQSPLVYDANGIPTRAPARTATRRRPAHQSPVEVRIVPEDERFVVTRAGTTLDASGMVWRLEDPSGSLTIDLRDIGNASGYVRAAIISYLRHLIRLYSVGEVWGNWSLIRMLDACGSSAESPLPYKVLGEVREQLGSHEHYRLHYLRKFYNWCCDQGFDGFSEDVAFEMNERVFGGNSKGEAVLSADPEEGPLDDREIAALTNALRGARDTSKLTLTELAATWLCVGLGSNSGQLALLREEDFTTVTAAGTAGKTYLLNVPRHKKGDPVARSQFRTRKLNAEIGGIVEALIDENCRTSPKVGDRGRPLLRRDTLRLDLDPQGELSDYSYHHVAKTLTDIVGRAVKKLGVTSHRTGEPLKVTVRRLRYTFATRLVREGASQRVVADALDHTDLQNVRVYFDMKSDVVERLDAAMALQLGPLSQAFLGTLVRAEADAVNGDRRSSRILKPDRAKGTLKPLGTCGSFSFCGLNAPVACYTCVRFQPWIDAPHQEALDGMLGERQRRHDEGQDPRMVTLFDTAILAIADVIVQIDEMRRVG